MTKIIDILNSKTALEEIAKTKMKLSVAYKFKKVINEFDEISKAFNEKNTEVLKKYGDEQENGSWNIPPENRSEFEREMNEILNEEIQVQITKLNINDLDDVEIEPISLMNLDWMLEE